MTDFFADLERELDSAYAREGEKRPAWRRVGGTLLPTLRPVLVSAMVAALAFGLFALVGTRGGGIEREAATPDRTDADWGTYAREEPHGYTTGCDGPIFVPPTVTDPVPQEVLEDFGVFRAGEASGLFPGRYGSQASQLFGKSARRPAPGVELVAALARVRGGAMGDVPGCRQPDAATEPSVCLSVDGSAAQPFLSGCATPREIRMATLFAEVQQGDRIRLVGVAPDGAKELVVGKDRLPVHDNLVDALIDGDAIHRGRHFEPAGEENAEGWTPYAPMDPADCKAAVRSGPAPEEIVRRISVFGRPSNVEADVVTRGLASQEGISAVFADHAQVVGARPHLHVIVPVGYGCEGGSGVCLMPLGRSGPVTCGGLPASAKEAIVISQTRSLGDGRWLAASVVTDGVGGIRAGGRTIVQKDNFAHAEITARDSAAVEIEPLATMDTE